MHQLLGNVVASFLAGHVLACVVNEGSRRAHAGGARSARWPCAPDALAPLPASPVSATNPPCCLPACLAPLQRWAPWQTPAAAAQWSCRTRSCQI